MAEDGCSATDWPTTASLTVLVLVVTPAVKPASATTVSAPVVLTRLLPADTGAPVWEPATRAIAPPPVDAKYDATTDRGASVTMAGATIVRVNVPTRARVSAIGLRGSTPRTAVIDPVAPAAEIRQVCVSGPSEAAKR